MIRLEFLFLFVFQKREDVLKEKEQREKEFKEQKERLKRKEQAEFDKVNAGPKIEEVTDEEAEKIKQAGETQQNESAKTVDTKVRKCEFFMIQMCTFRLESF